MAEARAPVTFDSALDSFAAVVAKRLGVAGLDGGRFLRDVDGRLTFVLSSNPGDATLSLLRSEIIERLGRYAADAPILTEADLFDPTVATDAAVHERIASWPTPRRVPVVDRRLVGQDWASDWGGEIAGAPPIIVFHSVKGGVGRSTALAILAADQARRGRNVLVVDLDMEAPGVGSLLLRDEDLPDLGVLDWFVETNLHDELRGVFDPQSIDLVQLAIAESPLTQGRGAVDVMPALGLECQARPWNVVTKLGRAFIDHPRQGWSHGFRLRQLLATAVQAERRYDVVLVDARAGLAEGTAPALIGLGATVLCFGVDTPATHVANRCLFSYLSGLTNSASRKGRDWRADFRIVHAKAQPGAEARRRFMESVYETFVDEVYDAVAEPESERATSTRSPLRRQQAGNYTVHVDSRMIGNLFSKKEGRSVSWHTVVNEEHRDEFGAMDHIAPRWTDARTNIMKFIAGHEVAPPDAGEQFSFDYDDEDAPHWPWPISFDVALAEFDPNGRPDQLTLEFVERSFGPFLERADALIRSSAPAGKRMGGT